jgi:hypothetical protein
MLSSPSSTASPSIVADLTDNRATAAAITRIAFRPIEAVAREKPDSVAPRGDHPISVLLDLVNPHRPYGDLRGDRRDARFDETWGAPASNSYATICAIFMKASRYWQHRPSGGLRA